MISKRENMLRLQPKSSATDGLNKCKMCLATLDRIATKCCSPTRRGSPPPTGLQHLVISYSLGLGAHVSSAPLAYSRHPYFICTLGKWSDCDTKTNQFVETSGGGGNPAPSLGSRMEDVSCCSFPTKPHFYLHLKSIIIYSEVQVLILVSV